MERTLIILKPDAVQRQLVGEIVLRLERKGLTLRALRFLQADEALAAAHYGVHQGKPFYPRLMRFITGGPLVASAWSGPYAIDVVRNLVGPTSGVRAPAGTVRGDFGVSLCCNLVHAQSSCSPANQIPLLPKSVLPGKIRWA